IWLPRSWTAFSIDLLRTRSGNAENAGSSKGRKNFGICATLSARDQRAKKYVLQPSTEWRDFTALGGLAGRSAIAPSCPGPSMMLPDARSLPHGLPQLPETARGKDCSIMHPIGTTLGRPRQSPPLAQAHQ